MKHYVLILAVVCGCFILGQSVPNAKPEKHSVAIKDVMRKICILSKKTLKNAAVDQKPELLKKLEAKVRKATKNLDVHDEMYIRVIMEGVKKMAYRNDYRMCEDNKTLPAETTVKNDDNPETVDNNDGRRSSGNQSNQFISFINKERNDTNKIALIKSMVVKIERIVKKYFKGVNTTEENDAVMKKLKSKINKAIVRHRKLKGNIDHETYGNLLLHGINLFRNNNDTRRMTMKLIDSIFAKSDVEPSLENNILHNKIHTTTKPVSTLPDCSKDKQNLCSLLKKLGEFPCAYDNTALSVEKVCNGNIDCPDGSDEKDCVQFANTKLQKATEIMHLTSSNKVCYNHVINKKSYEQHNKLLTDLLADQVQFLNDFTKKYHNIDPKTKINVNNTLIEEGSVTDITNKITNEISILLHSFVVSYESMLCTNLTYDFEKIFEKFNLKRVDGKIAESEIKTIPYTFKMCTCKEKFCENATCPTACKRICFQKYSLQRHLCSAISEGDSVPISQLCDGKIDCIDRSDETDCVIYNSALKFDANNYFLGALKLIKDRLTFNDYPQIRVNLAKLHESITTLRKLSIPVSRTSEDHFVELRDSTFRLFEDIYDDFLDNLFAIDKAENSYDLLNTIKVKLIGGLKRSYLGNKLVEAPSGCLCNRQTCVLPKCSNICVKTCEVRPNITELICHSSPAKQTVSTNLICNRKKDCPGGEDEEYCKDEKCGPRHVGLLRQKMQRFSWKRYSHMVQDTLDLWKSKVLVQVEVLEKESLNAPIVLRPTIGEILDNLTSSYLSLEGYKSFNDFNVTRKFWKVGQCVLSAIKYCGNEKGSPQG